MSYPPFQLSRSHKFVVGSGSGDHGSLTSGSFASFASSAYSLTMNNVQIGDTLIVSWACGFTLTTTDDVVFAVNINGAAPGSTDSARIFGRTIVPNTADIYTFNAFIPWIVTASDIDANNNTSVEVMYRVTGGTLNIENSNPGAGSLPYLMVTNIGPRDTT